MASSNLPELSRRPQAAHAERADAGEQKHQRRDATAAHGRRRARTTGAVDAQPFVGTCVIGAALQSNVSASFTKLSTAKQVFLIARRVEVAAARLAQVTARNAEEEGQYLATTPGPGRGRLAVAAGAAPASNAVAGSFTRGGGAAL